MQGQRPMLERTTLQLFRDCLRTAHHIGGDSAKGRALKQVVKDGFRKHIGVTDAAEISKKPRNCFQLFNTGRMTR